MTRRALLIYNPAARKAPSIERLHAAAGGVAGWEITFAATEASGHATELARQAATDGFDAVVACGGDGTVNEVANGLASGTTALAVVRGGTANVWAKEVGVPRDAAKALALLNDGDTRTIDLGRAGARYFLCMAGAGFDAAIVREMQTSKLKKRIGAAAYIVTGFRLARRYAAVNTELFFDNARAVRPVFWLMAGNTRNYGGVLNIAHMARVDDGRIEALLLERGGLWRLTQLLPLVLLKRHHRGELVTHRSVTSLDVRTAGLPVQVDGEYVGETPLRFEVAARALRVVIPRSLSSPLFSQE
jgi:YegS/Rv2252/BmrU family lipid kinase